MIKKIARTRWIGGLLVVAAILGLFGSYSLLKAELNVLENPELVLGCDINPLIACSDSLLSPQAHLFFGLPNSAIGILIFGMLLAVSTVLTFNGRLPRIVLGATALGSVAGLGYVCYFLYLSIAIFGALCPYCMVIWLAILLAAPILIGLAFSRKIFSGGKKFGEAVLKYWWAILIIEILLVALAIVLGMADQIYMAIG